MIKAIDVVGCIADVHVGIDITNIVALAIVVPSGDLDNIWVDGLNGLNPACIPQRVALFDPISVGGTKVLELPRRNGYRKRINYNDLSG